MRPYNRKNQLWLAIAVSAVLSLLLAACGAPKPEPTPTLSVDAIYTAAYSTMLAQQATNVALTPPTATATPTQLPTLPAAPTLSGLPTLALTSPTLGFTTGGGGGSTACDSSVFAGDVTIPDNTVIDPGKKFTKTWSLLNKGTCTWDSNYKLALQSGDAMGGVTTAITGSVPSGSTVNISVQLVAPTAAGTYKGIWRLQNGSGQFFGDTPWVIIKVGTGGPTVTPGGPTLTPAPSGCPSNVCTVTVSANVRDFTIQINDAHAAKAHLSECIVPSGGTSCTFTVPLNWDGSVVISKGKYTWTPSDTCTLTNVANSTRSCTFTGDNASATATATP